ncbi:MAG: TetR/AcrR family transcriptional regulator [Candidatus Binatia bacterium]
MASNETQQRILDAAECLFASEGFAATSLRTVIARAGVNIAAIHYHYGSKEALIQAVFARRIGPLNEERLRRLDACEAAAGPLGPSVEEILESFIRPALRLKSSKTSGRPVLIELLSSAHNESGGKITTLLYRQFEQVSARFLRAFQTALPRLPVDELYVRFHFLIGTMATSLSDPERLAFLSAGQVDPTDTESLASMLVAFLAAGLRAPATVVDASNTRAAAKPSHKKALRDVATPTESM